VVEILRRNLVESRHRAAVAVTDADGEAVLAIGDVTTPIFERSAVKALQALPLVETGAADAFGFGDEELALACASHSGEARYVAGITRMLANAGLDAATLRYGAHWPTAQSAVAAVARTGEPSALRNWNGLKSARYG
jgi:L-asparaginase II